MRVKNMFSALLACMSLLIASCGSGDEIEYIAFRNGENMWGLVAPNGEVLFEGKFKHKPSLVLHGVFSVKMTRVFMKYTLQRPTENLSLGRATSTMGALVSSPMVSLATLIATERLPSVPFMPKCMIFTTAELLFMIR